MNDRFQGKGVLVSGAASGMGLASARRFHTEGAAVVLLDVNPAGTAIARELGERATFLECDVSDFETLGRVVSDAISWLEGAGRHLDVLFNNAGIAGGGETPDLAPEEWHRVFDVDVHSIFHVCRVAIPAMRESGGGAIVNMGSVSGLRGDYGLTVYNAAKAAVVNYTRALALDHAKDGIRVNAVCPGLITTGQTEGLAQIPGILDDWNARVPLGRAGLPEEVAGAVTFLASEDASYVTGTTLVVDGGITAGTGQPNIPAFV